MTRSTERTLKEWTEEAILAAAFERLRQRLVALIVRRVGARLAARIDPEGVVNDAFLRACPRWLAADPKPADIDAWIYSQTVDRLIEVIRSALGPTHNVDRELPWPCDPGDHLVASLVDPQAGPSTALSRVERREMVRECLRRLDPIDREILALRHFDELNFIQIGTILGLSQNAVTKRALRAMVELRNLIPACYRPPQANQR